MSGDRDAYLDTLARQLWPVPAAPRLRRGGPGYLVVPSARRPRLLIAPGPGAAAAVRASFAATTRLARLRQAAAVTVFRLGAADWLFRDRLDPGGAGLAGHLADLLGPGVRISVQVGPARANRKPVVQVRDRRGPLAYAKLGVCPLTARLVRAEARALRRLADAPLTRVVVPRITHFGDWRGMPLLVQAALRPVGRRAAPAVRRAEHAAMREVAEAAGVRHAPLAGSGYVRRLRAAVRRLGSRAEAAELTRCADAVGSAPAAFGCWHGDWHGGNRVVGADGRVLLWDWERFDDDVPVGYDALHRRLHWRLAGGASPASAAADLLRGAPDRLACLGQPAPAGDVAALYLVELAVRYLGDGQQRAGQPLGDVESWIVPALAGWRTRREDLG